MEKSIESIWKEGFLESDALIAPKINNLYNQKSIHIIDKFQRMFRINLIAVVAFSFAVLIISFFVGIPITGIIIFITLSLLAFINKKLLNGLNKVDKGVSSYQYLKSFNAWMQKQITINKKISRFLYPILFMAMVLGFWFKDAEGMYLGKRLVSEILIGFPDMYLIYGIPLIGIVIGLFILVFLAIFGGRIYMWDFNIVYGRVFAKLKELMIDIESLRS